MNPCHRSDSGWVHHVLRACLMGVLNEVSAVQDDAKNHLGCIHDVGKMTSAFQGHKG